MKKINGHIILTIIGNNYHIKCGTCGRHCKKSMQGVYQSKRCKKCQDIITLHYAGRSIKQWCWILSLNEFTIRNRIKRGWTIKEALFQDKRVYKESFTEKDCKYICNFYSNSYNKDKELSNRSELHYKKKDFLKSFF